MGTESTQVKGHWWPLGAFSCLKNDGVILRTRENTPFRAKVSSFLFIKKR